MTLFGKKMNTLDAIKKQSAFAPILMSLVALTVVAVHVAKFGGARDADEGAAAHVWQILMVAQVPVIVLFVTKGEPGRAHGLNLDRGVEKEPWVEC